jgi:hypothetical protein
VNLGETGGKGNGKGGRKLTYVATVQGNGNLLVGKAYTVCSISSPAMSLRSSWAASKSAWCPPARPKRSEATATCQVVRGCDWLLWQWRLRSITIAVRSGSGDFSAASARPIPSPAVVFPRGRLVFPWPGTIAAPELWETQPNP